MNKEKILKFKANQSILILSDILKSIESGKLIKFVEDFTSLPSSEYLIEIGQTMIDKGSLILQAIFPLFSHLHFVLFQSSQKKADTSNLQNFISDLDSITQRLTSLGFDLAEFYSKHVDCFDSQESVTEV